MSKSIGRKILMSGAYPVMPGEIVSVKELVERFGGESD
jgi:hypothetical protein